jgi:hypothetical protein
VRTKRTMRTKSLHVAAYGKIVRGKRGKSPQPGWPGPVETWVIPPRMATSLRRGAQSFCRWSRVYRCRLTKFPLAQNLFFCRQNATVLYEEDKDVLDTEKRVTNTHRLTGPRYISVGIREALLITSSPKVTDSIEPLAHSAAAMATPPLQWPAQFQSMFRRLSWQSHWSKVERDRVFWSFVQRSERGR